MFWMQTMTPIERLDALILDGTMSIAENGYVMWCYLCDSFTQTEGPFEDTHEWFMEGARRYMAHVSECDKRARLASMESSE